MRKAGGGRGRSTTPYCCYDIPRRRKFLLMSSCFQPSFPPFLLPFIVFLLLFSFFPSSLHPSLLLSFPRTVSPPFHHIFLLCFLRVLNCLSSSLLKRLFQCLSSAFLLLILSLSFLSFSTSLHIYSHPPTFSQSGLPDVLPFNNTFLFILVSFLSRLPLFLSQQLFVSIFPSLPSLFHL